MANCLEPQTQQEAWAYAQRVAASRLFPGITTADQAFVVIMLGAELGVGAMQALRSIQIVKGRPSLSADLLVALVRRSPLCEQWAMPESSDTRCTITAKRTDDTEPRSLTWTLEMAKRAGLGGDNWSKYPRAMLRARCSAELARALFPDVAAGLYVEGEITSDDRRTQPTPATSSPERDDDEPLTEGLQKLVDDLASLGGSSLQAEQVVTVWADHYDALSPAERDRAWTLCEAALADGNKTRFKSLAREHESRVASAKRGETADAASAPNPAPIDLDALRANIANADTLQDLEAIRDALPKGALGALAEDLWLCRIRLAPSLDDLQVLEPRAREIAAKAMRSRVVARLEARIAELAATNNEARGE